MKPLILYVDDERPNRIVFEQSFTELFRIRAVASAEEALTSMKDETPAVLVTDQRMPGMSGNELLERAKEMYPETIRVVVTAYSDLDPILRAVNDGLVARYVVKPWDRTELEEILRWGVEAYTLGQQNSALQLRLLQTERLVTLGTIGSAVVHDLNQPISYLLANSERMSQLSESLPALERLLRDHGHELRPEHAQRLQDLITELPAIVQDMIEGCSVMHGLTGNVRRLLRPSAANDLPARTEPLAVVRYAISACREVAMKARGNIFYDGPTSLPMVRIGSTELTQVLINIVANAAQSLARREPGGRVMVSASESGGMVRFVVADNGPGMSAEVLAKVGTPFFSTRLEGTGLGVVQCRRLTESAGGRVTLESTEGVGTTVTVVVPKVE